MPKYEMTSNLDPDKQIQISILYNIQSIQKTECFIRVLIVLRSLAFLFNHS